MLRKGAIGYLHWSWLGLFNPDQDTLCLNGNVFCCGRQRSIASTRGTWPCCCLSKQRTCAHREALEILSTDVGSRVSLSDDKTKQAESRRRRRSVNTMQRARIPSDLFPDSSWRSSKFKDVIVVRDTTACSVIGDAFWKKLLPQSSGYQFMHNRYHPPKNPLRAEICAKRILMRLGPLSDRCVRKAPCGLLRVRLIYCTYNNEQNVTEIMFTCIDFLSLTRALTL